MRDVSQTLCKDAERSERQSTSKSDAKCKDKTREKESRVADDGTAPRVLEAREREQHGSTRRGDRSISARTGLGRGVPADP